MRPDAAEPSARWPDLAGRIEGHAHVLPIRTYFEDTDFSGLVYHASYLRFFERGRSDFVRLLGVHHTDLANPADGSDAKVFVVRRMELDFLRPATIDEVLEVHTSVDAVGGASLTLIQEIRRGDTRLVAAKVVVVLISKAGKPQRIADLFRGRLQDFVNHDLTS